MSSVGRVILRGAGARVTATPDHLFRADISSGSLALLFRAGRIPEELQQQATDWINAILAIAAIETETQNDREGRTFTRRSLINTLTRFRRHVAQGRVTSASRNIEQHLLDAETARLRHERLGDRWWGPLAHATLDQLFEVRRQAVTRIKACRGDTAGLLALLDDAIAALRVAPERTFEVMARRGRLDPNVQSVTSNVAAFWTTQLGRRHDDIKGMIALADVVWRFLGQPKSAQALREAFARTHRERRASDRTAANH